MELKDIPFHRLKQIAYESAAVRRAAQKGRELARRIFEEADVFHKVWPATSKVHRTVYVSGAPLVVESNVDAAGNEQLLGFLCGLYDKAICPGFIENIYSDGKLVGYSTRRGKPLTEKELKGADCASFVEYCIQRSLEARHVMRDLHVGNLVRLPDGRISLIDLETPISHLDTLDLNMEIQTGALRRGIIPAYRQFLLDFFDLRCSDPTIIAARTLPFRLRTSQLVQPKRRKAAASSNGVDVKTGFSGLEEYVPIRASADGEPQREDIVTWMQRIERELETI